MPQNDHLLPRNNGNPSESKPQNFFKTKFRSKPYEKTVDYFTYKISETVKIPCVRTTLIMTVLKIANIEK